MTVQDMVQEQLEDDGDDLLDFISEGEGENLDDLEKPIQMDESFPSTVFISNVPKVNKEKFTKLMTVLSKLVDKYGASTKAMPFNEETGMTMGFFFVTYEKVEDADNAAKTLDGMSLDRTHTFKVCKLDSFDEIVDRPEEFQSTTSLNTYSRADFRTWLEDSKCREQFLLRYQAETEIHWHDAMAGVPQLCYGGEREKRQKKIWCDWRVQWSPMGSYIATFHEQGIAIWAGPDFLKKMRYAHQAAKFIDFSPNEEFLLTWNGAHSSENDDNAVRIFRVQTGECVRKCKTPTVAPVGGEFPHFMWSPDGRYFAECSETTIFVRDSKTMDLIKDDQGKKRTLKYDALSTFQWSPKDNIIAAWCLEKNNNPARLVLIDIPSRTELASRSRTQVEAVMHWQSAGDYLCLLVTKLSKTKKKGSTNLEIFRVRDKNIPVDIVEVKDTVRGFFWESAGHRFAVITTDESGHHPKLLFYALGAEKCEQVCFIDLPTNSFNTLFWAPEGQYFVCSAIGNGDLLFGGLMPDNKLEILHKDEHFMLTDVQWDPSSRYVITAVTQPMRDEMGGFKYQMEAGYAIWTFQGRIIHKLQKEKLWQVSWRPHPPSLLNPEKQKEIKKNIKTFSKRYDALDDQAKEAARSAFKQDRDTKTDAFRTVLERLDEYKKQATEENGWADAWNRHLENQGWEMQESFTEEEMDTTEELISG